jgi:hypothetical protein
VLTKARKQAVTRCWAAGDEDWRRRWAEFAEAVAGGVRRLRNSLDRLGRGLREGYWGQGNPRCSNGVESPWRNISPAAVVGGNPVQTRLGPGQRNSEKTPGAQAILLRGSLASAVRWGGVAAAAQSGGTAGLRCCGGWGVCGASGMGWRRRGCGWG